MSSRDDNILRQVCQLTVDLNAASGTLAFEKSEFSRLPDDSKNMSQLTSEALQEVVDALYRSLTTGINSMMVGRSGPSVQFIAAQFKNTNMRNSQLEPKVIEVALTKIIDNLDQYPQLKAIQCNLSYTNDGSMMAAKGVRTFCIKGRD
ncbi:unnamed protein product [Rotaria sp. Silwood1]|nr:unnamed protein product [Rotaria sp. Silwood1]